MNDRVHLNEKGAVKGLNERVMDINDRLKGFNISLWDRQMFIAGIFLASKQVRFIKGIESCKSHADAIGLIIDGIESVLRSHGIDGKYIDDVCFTFRALESNQFFLSIDIGDDDSLVSIAKDICSLSSTMLNEKGSRVDLQSMLCHDVIKYSDGTGGGSIPLHISDFAYRLMGDGLKWPIIDICCGTGSLLMAALDRVDAKDRRNKAYGIEANPNRYVMAVMGLIVMGSYRSNVIHADCFSEDATDFIERIHPKTGFINPPFSKMGNNELEYVERLLDSLDKGGIAVAIVPKGYGTGTRYNDVRRRLFKSHSLKCVISLPDDVLYPRVNASICLMMWEAHIPHDSEAMTLLCKMSDDGLTKRKGIGKIDIERKWPSIRDRWVTIVTRGMEMPGESLNVKLKHHDEWLAEAYLKRDPSNIDKGMFRRSCNSFISSMIASPMPYDKERVIDAGEWGLFKLVGDNGLFEYHRGKRLVRGERVPGYSPLVTAGTMDNGIGGYITGPKDMVRYENCITIDVFCNTFYHRDGVFCDDNILILVPKWDMTPYEGMFIATMISLEREGHSYDRQYRGKVLQGHSIRLPQMDGAPDFDYMNSFMEKLGTVIKDRVTDDIGSSSRPIERN